MKIKDYIILKNAIISQKTLGPNSKKFLQKSNIFLITWLKADYTDYSMKNILVTFRNIKFYW